MATSFLVVKNRSYSKLAAALTAGATTMTVTAGEGANFPSTYPFHLTIEDEIVSCTNRATDTLTIVREQQGTTGAAHPNKAHTALNITAKSVTDLNTVANRLETDVPTYVATGDMRYASAAGVGLILTIGATDTILSVQGGVPTWRTPANILTDLSGQAGADFSMNTNKITSVTDPTSAQDAATKNYVDTTAVLDALFDAHTILYAVSDDTPLALTVAASRIIGRKASGNIAAMTGAETLALLTGANLDVGAFDVRGQTVTADGLTSTRVVFAGASGVLSGDSDFTFVTDTLTVTKIAAFILTGMIDVNGNTLGDGTDELITFTEVTSPVNQINITNAATGERPIVSVVGDDTDINMRLKPKGIGHIDIPFTLPSTAGEELDGIFISVDASAQVSTAVFQAYHVETTGSPAGAVEGMTTVGEVAPIHQHVASLVTPDQGEFAGRKTGGGASWADGIDGLEIFVDNSDAIFVGAATQFDEIEVIFGTAATKNCVPAFFYSTGASTWTQFFPSDGTAGFTSSGNISWTLGDISLLWLNTGDPGGGLATDGFWIRIDRTRVADPGSPTPTTIKIGAATEYQWDKTGALTVLSVTTASLALEQAGVDTKILNMDSSDVITGLTTATSTVDVATNDFGAFSKFAGATGGLLVQALGENAAVTTNLILESYGGQASTTKSTSGRGLAEIYVSQHDGANALSNVTNDGNILVIRSRVGGSDTTQAIFSAPVSGGTQGGLWLNGAITAGGPSISNKRQYHFAGAYSSGGAGNDASKQTFSGALTGFSGDISRLTGSEFVNTIVTQSVAETIGVVAQIYVAEPNITKNVTTITVAASLYIAAAPDEGTTNAAIYVKSGAVRLGEASSYTGLLELVGTTSGVVGVTVVAAAGTWTMTLPTGVAGGAGYQLTDAAPNGVTSWAAAASLREHKENIVQYNNPSEALDLILNTKVYEFNYKEGRGTQDTLTRYVGLMADEAPWGMHYEGGVVNPVNTLGYMVLGMQALDTKIESVNQKIERLQTELAELKASL